jgi:excisionase family DNA binding protein
MNTHNRQAVPRDSNGPWQNKKQLADYYGCSTRTIENLMRGGVLPFVRIRRFIRFNVIECDRVMEKYKQRSALLEEA